MLKTGIFHPQLLRVLGEIRHKDLLVIGDAGLPIPKGVERIDLGWKQGSPGYLEVLEEIAKALNDTASNMREQDAQIASGWKA